MTTASEITQMKDLLLDSYGAVEEMGGTLPEQKTLANLPDAIDTIPTSMPTGELIDLKRALDAGTAPREFPPNSEVSDVYDGNEIKWVIGHYGTATMANGAVRDGVYVFKSVTLNTRQALNPNEYYDESAVNVYLNSTYYENCSGTLKEIVGEIQVPVYTDRSVNAKIWLMSAVEIMGLAPTANNGGGVGWDAWKVRTGLSSPTYVENDGRILETESGSAATWWTRSHTVSSSGGGSSQFVNFFGGVRSVSTASNYYLEPAFFIPKD